MGAETASGSCTFARLRAAANQPHTSNSPDKLLSSCKMIQTSPDAPTGC